MIAPSTRYGFISYGDGLAWPAPLGLGAQSLAVSPPTINTTATTTVTFTGVGTTWNSTPPTFTPTGVAGVSTGTRTVIDDTHATLVVTTLGTTGTITWSDSTSSGTCTEIVQFAGLQIPKVVWLPFAYWKEDYV